MSMTRTGPVHYFHFAQRLRRGMLLTAVDIRGDAIDYS